MPLPKQVIFALIIECLMIILTTVFLAQPQTIFNNQSERAKSIVRIGGFFLLCLTFCWSVVFGTVLALNSIFIRV